MGLRVCVSPDGKGPNATVVSAESSKKTFLGPLLSFRKFWFLGFRLNSSSGYIIDNPGNYSKDLRCSWLLDGRDGSGKTENGSGYGGVLTLTIDAFATECGWDHLYIYDGDGVYSKQLAALRYEFYGVWRVLSRDVSQSLDGSEGL